MQLNPAPSSRERFLEAVLKSSLDCIKVLDLDAKLVFMSDGGKLVMEVDDFDSVKGCPWPDFWKGEGHKAAEDALEAARSGKAGRFRGKADTFKGNPRWWDVEVTPLLGHDGRPQSLLCVSRDITKTVQDEEQTRLLADELQHRVKNTLSMVQAIVRQTLRGTADVDVALAAIEARLVALGRAHGMLSASGWTTSDLHSVVAAALGAHNDGSGRVLIAGPEVLLQAKAAMSMTLLLHELATNATKYGALSTSTGRVEIGWKVRSEVDDGEVVTRVDLVWRESGGPPVTLPTSRGFGSRLIERSLANAFKGTAVIEFLNEGVTCHVEGVVERRLI